MRQMSAQRRRVVASAGALAAMGGVGPAQQPEHLHLDVLPLCFIVCMLAFVIAQLVKLKKQER